jgi:hypothetical protein
VSEMPEPLTIDSPAFPSSPGGARMRVGSRPGQYPSGPAGVPLSPPIKTIVDRPDVSPQRVRTPLYPVPQDVPHFAVRLEAQPPRARLTGRSPGWLGELVDR